MQLLCGSRSDFLLVADSGPGETNATGLIVPKFGKNPENHVAVSLSFDALSELLLITQAHYSAWLSAWYACGFHKGQQRQTPAKQEKVPERTPNPSAERDTQWF